MKILTISQMRQIEQDSANIGLPPDKLMENAGRAFAEEARKILGDVKGKEILFLVGPGNNGGDGMIAARHLHDWGAKVGLFLFGERDSGEPNFTLIRECGIDCISLSEDESLQNLEDKLAETSAVVDALFGIGRIRPFHGILRQALDIINQTKLSRPKLRIIALDLPSGLNADTGAIDPGCLYADHTITLGFPKAGLLRPPGAARVGSITVANIGIPAYLAEQVSDELIDRAWARSVLPPRPLQGHKGSFGKALIIAGSVNYVGAAHLACMGALRVGSGLVTLGTPTTLYPILAGKLTEVTHLPLPEAQRGIVSPSAAKIVHQHAGSYHALLLGCGLGDSRAAVEFVENTLLKTRGAPPPLVIDADGLNALARIPGWWRRFTADAVFTPHPGEIARLAEMSVEDVQRDRLGLVRTLAQEWQKTIVLKGAYTIIAAPDGRTRTNPVANPGLATAGTGDVLSGVIVGLLAQGMPLFDAASLGAYLHGQAGEMVSTQLGDTGMLASDLLPVLPQVIRQLKD